MKRHLIYTVGGALLMAAGLVTSCDIAEDDRYIEMPIGKMERTVLLMDFTGQRCVNCPEAHEVVEDLVEQYSDSALIAVSIHAGALATSVDRTNFERNNIGLMIEEGQEMNDAFGIESWPMGAVDKINDLNAAMTSDKWPDAVYNALQQPAGALINLEASYNPDNSMITISGEAMSSTTRNAAIQYWIVENGIVARQDSKNGKIEDYVHNNVLRDVVYPVKTGQPLTLVADVWSDKIEASVQCKWTDKERWNPDSLFVVAFVSEGTNILNAARVKIKNVNTEE